MSILYFWIAATILFLLIEMATTTFYGLSLAFASAIVAGVVFALGDTEFTILQGGIFALSSIIFSLLLPRLLIAKWEDVPQWADRYIGEKRSVKKVWGDQKISLDGVDYLIESDDEITVGDRVEVIGHKGVTMKVKLAK